MRTTTCPAVGLAVAVVAIAPAVDAAAAQRQAIALHGGRPAARAASPRARSATRHRGHRSLRARARRRRQPARAPVGAPRWIEGAEVTEYFPVPESWFSGQRVAAPGLPDAHRVDWLYSARGVSMEGEGIGLDGVTYHIDALGSGGWIDAAGAPTSPGAPDAPWWRAGGYWLTKDRAPTFPLETGGWYHGLSGATYVAPPAGISFARGAARALVYYQSLAVDPKVIPLHSRVLIPAYADVTPSHGWFEAADTGGAIGGAHVDVYRPPPAGPSSPVRHLTGQRIYVVPPGANPAPGAQGPVPPSATSPGAARAPA